MTADMLPRQSADIPFEGMEGEQPRDLLVEAKTLLLLAHDENRKAQARRLSVSKKREHEKNVAAFIGQANLIIAEHLGIDMTDKYYTHDQRMIGARHDLRQQALNERQAAADTARKVGSQMYQSARNVQNMAPDFRSRAAHDYGDDD